MADQQRRDEEARRTAERRDSEARMQLETQQKMLEAMMARAEVHETPTPTQTVRLPTLQEGGYGDLHIQF